MYQTIYNSLLLKTSYTAYINSLQQDTASEKYIHNYAEIFDTQFLDSCVFANDATEQVWLWFLDQ